VNKKQNGPRDEGKLKLLLKAKEEREKEQRRLTT
jgi:hypothetical protein